MVRWDDIRWGLRDAVMTLVAISWVLSALAAIGALLAAAFTVAFGPLVVLLWAEHRHPSPVLMRLSALVAAATVGMLVACWRWRTSKRGRWILLGASFAIGQIVLVSLSWMDRAAVSPWLAALPAAAIGSSIGLAVCFLAWFALLWGDGKGFGT
jgi:hypothetical protein